MQTSSVTKVSRYRDEIHGDVILDPVAVALLNTEALQRLGKIYQLGYTHLVYRGATHTRLSHVVGAFHMAGRFVDLLRENYRLMTHLPPKAARPSDFLPREPGATIAQEENHWICLKYLVQWAGLLHDVGHIPLGHTLEDEFEGIYVSHDDFRSPRLPALWWGHDERKSEIREVFSSPSAATLLPKEFGQIGLTAGQALSIVRAICLFKEKRLKEPSGDKYVGFESLLTEALEATDEKKLEGAQREFVITVKRELNELGTWFAPYMVDIVSNTICADYMDYVRRDTTNTGLDRQSDDRVLSQFLVGEQVAGKSRQYRMALLLTDSRGKARLDTCTGVVDLVRKRFRLAEIIYYHKTKVSASAMLAKALSLIGRPAEVSPTPARLIRLGEVSVLARQIAGGSTDPAKLQKECGAPALLSPEIGDESLPLWLLERAWEDLKLLIAPKLATNERNNIDDVGEAQKKTLRKIEEKLRGIGMLQLLVRRRLYKVFVQINSLCVGHFNGLDDGDGQPNPEQLQQKMNEVLSLRKKHDERATIEMKMAQSAGWPADSVLIYIPPLKSQAKGIETKALTSGGVVTLGEHPTISAEVLALGTQYSRLWRVILLVHPDYQNDDLGLSRAFDVMLHEVWNLDARECEADVKAVARFEYIPRSQRDAAQLFLQLCQGTEPNWRAFRLALETVASETSIDYREHAYRAYVLSESGDLNEAVELLRDRFTQIDSVLQFVLDGNRKRVDDVDEVRKRLGEMPVEGTSAMVSPSTEPEGKLSAQEFESRCRAIFRKYIPPSDSGSLRSQHRDFISKYRSRSPAVRHRLVTSLTRYDLGASIRPQYNREDDEVLEKKLSDFAKEILGEDA